MRVAVCEDESSVRHEIVAYLEPYKKTNNVQISEFESGNELIQSYKKGIQYNVLLLDIEMVGMNGLEAGGIIRKMDKHAIIVYLTNHDSYIFKSIKLGISDYLLKPINRDNFDEMFQTVIHQYQEEHFIVSLKWESSIYNVDIKDVIYIEGYNRRVIYHMLNGSKYKTLGKLDDHEKMLRGYNFLRCHYGFIVNMKLIESFEKKCIIMSDGSMINASTRRKSECMMLYNKYLSGYTIWK